MGPRSSEPRHEDGRGLLVAVRVSQRMPRRGIAWLLRSSADRRASSRRVTVGGLLRALPAAARDLAYVVGAVVVIAWAWHWISPVIDGGLWGFDFMGTLWEPALAIREGRSPYPSAIVYEVQVGNPALYPPLLMICAVPLTLLPWAAGLAVWTSRLALGVIAAL